MKKIIKLTENDLIKLVKKVIQEQNMGNKGLEISATVEGDMSMTFRVLEFVIQNGKIGMVLKHKDAPLGKDPNRVLVVYNFGGPIFDKKTGQKIYTDVSFGNIGSDNFMNLAKQNGIPVTKK